MKKIIVMCFFSMLFFALHAEKQFTLKSPDGVLSTTIVIGEKLTYDICCNGNQVLMQSPISMILSDGTVWGEKPRLQKSKTASVDESVNSPFCTALNGLKLLSICSKHGSHNRPILYTNSPAKSFPWK